ncbi:hypothetical protein MSG28_003280 [Choristoneura fumiferana]|uniref:Uncharacterized protein n=1 Tax=Choristoneura fumiferana TaxID=7141 RepID=A0ACC0KEV6_CHOFU|nr:hypothetical protein MSG28_003280 [Choristoneura fumiferana]
MDKIKTCGYCVIEVLDPPYTDFERYISVPSSWVSLQKTPSGDAAVVKFPIEHLSDTKKRIRKREECSADWNTFKVNIIYTTVSYELAQKFIKSYKTKGGFKKNYATNNRDKVASSSPFNTITPKIIPSQNINIPNPFLALSSDDVRVLRPPARKTTLLPASTEISLHQNNETQTRSKKQSNDWIEQHANCNSSAESTAKKVVSEGAKEKPNETFEMDTIKKTIANIPKEQHEKKINHRMEETMDANENNVNDSDKNETASSYSHPTRKFTLPKEYDKNNSRWTLKHLQKKKGLVELLPNSGVYVDAIRLSNCKRISKDSKMLARMLLVEVFSANALRTCSLTGKRAYAFHTDETDIRPGLDEHAKNVLLNFVEEFANEKNWVKTSNLIICNSLRNSVLIGDRRIKVGQQRVCRGDNAQEIVHNAAISRRKRLLAQAGIVRVSSTKSIP